MCSCGLLEILRGIVGSEVVFYSVPEDEPESLVYFIYLSLTVSDLIIKDLLQFHRRDLGYSLVSDLGQYGVLYSRYIFLFGKRLLSCFVCIDTLQSPYAYKRISVYDLYALFEIVKFLSIFLAEFYKGIRIYGI